MNPSLANARDVSYPIPVELPVTTATLWLVEDSIYFHAYINTPYIT
jgi:hypothetical protein